MKPRHTQRRNGFTLVEVAAAMVLMAIGMIALVMASGTVSRVNAGASEMSQATMLAQEIREYCIGRPPGDSDPNGIGDAGVTVYNPPVDATGTAMSSMDDWTQTVTRSWVNPDGMGSDPNGAIGDCMQVVVTVSRNNRTLLTTCWLVTR
jgi:prepilin-type N-terminal cleavage/methylation domain-containing protein